MTKWNEFKTKILMLSKGEKLVLLFCFSFLVSLFPAGCIAKVFIGEWDAGLLRGFVLALTTGYGIVTALVFACAITFIIIRFSVNNTDLNATKEVDDRGVATSMAGTYGTARWMNETEAKKVYEVGPVENVTGTILGQFTQDGEEVIALPFEPTGNRNLILIGPPGSGKSFGYVRTAVFQSIVRGESVVVTDPKGEIHNDMRKLLESRGYKVKVFNLINLDLSNAWDCVQEIYDPITGNIDDQRVITFCKTVIANTGGGANSKGDPFWESSEENLFRVAVSYCAYIREKSLIEIYERRAKELLTQLPYITQEDEQSLIEIVKNPESAMVDRRRVVEYLAHSFYGDEEGNRKLSEWEEDAPTCNISDIYDALLHNDLDKWEANFKYVPLSHPAASAWAVFKGMGERVQPNIVGGLNTRLQLFMTYKVRRVISNDDIRLANLGAEKTALFLIISDDNASMQLLSSLLLSFLFKDLKEAFDAVGGEGRIPVNVVADELANTGVWPNFEKTIATARSRKIAVSLILQSLPQLTQLYGEENAETIIGCCNTMLVLGCNDKYTAEYISDKSGIVTIRASLFEFIQRVIRFRQSRRISKYNPRIKTELEPEYLIHDGRMLPKDKLKQMLGTVKGKVLGEENGPISSDITDEELKVFYDDDYGFLEKPDALKSKAELRAEAKQRAKEEKEYINSLPRSERKAAREEIKRKREQEEAEKKAKEAERERIINEAIKKRLDKAERVKTAQYYEKFMDPDNEQENNKPEENNAELNPQAVEFKPVTVGPSNNAVQDDVDIFDSEESIDTDEVEANVQADADTELFEDGTDTDIQAPQIDDVVFDDETEVLDVDEDLDDLSVDIQDTQSAQPAKQGRGQVVNSDDDVSLDDVDLFDDTTVSRTEERPQNVKTSGKTMGSQKQPQTTQNNSDIDYMSLNDISIFDSEE